MEHQGNLTVLLVARWFACNLGMGPGFCTTTMVEIRGLPLSLLAIFRDSTIVLAFVHGSGALLVHRTRNTARR